LPSSLAARHQAHIDASIVAVVLRASTPPAVAAATLGQLSNRRFRLRCGTGRADATS